jgi:UDP-N-acetylmuramate dehydrogenase
MLDTLEYVQHDVDLTNYNTYHIHTKCQYLIAPKNTTDLKKVIAYLSVSKLPFMILGNGSNVILPDNYYNGAIIILKQMDNEIVFNGREVKCAAGIMLPYLASASFNHNLKGLEWAVGIPGTLGGSIMGNAGAYLSCIMDYVIEIEVMDYNGQIKTIDKSKIDYEYRNTSLKKNRKYIILSAKLLLDDGNKQESLAISEDRKLRRLASQPLEYPSSGSVFRNPSASIPAGRLIEESGLKGKSIGGAEISLKHANFIINKDSKASAKDIKELIKLIQETIKIKNNIDLVCEQEIIEWK